MACNIPTVQFDFGCVSEFIQGVRNNDPIVVSIRRACTLALGITQYFSPPDDQIIISEATTFDALVVKGNLDNINFSSSTSIPPEVWGYLFQLVMWWLENRKPKNVTTIPGQTLKVEAKPIK